MARMKQNIISQVPPPPPDAPSILASNVDADAERIADELMGNAPAAPIDTEADQIANELMQLPAEMPQSLPTKPATKSQPKVEKKAAAPQPVGNFIKTGNPAAKPVKMNVPPPPDPMTTYLGGLAMAPFKALDSGIGALRQNPVIGPTFNHLAAIASAEGAERRKHPLESSAATLGVGIPRGILGLGEDIGNIIARSTGHGAPFNFRGLVDNLPGAPAVQQAYPGSVAGGETAGASAIPASAPLKFIANPVIRHAAQGALAGEVLGAVGHGGQQAKQGPVDFGAALQAGIPTAVMGGALGGLGAAAPKAFKAMGGKAKPVEPQAPQASESIKLQDGSELSPADAIKAINDPTTPPQVTSEIQQLLAAKDREILGLGSARKKAAKQEVRPTAFDDLTKNPTPKEIDERISSEIAKATDLDAVNTIENDASKLISQSIKMKPLQNAAMEKLTQAAKAKRESFAATEAPKQNTDIPQIPFSEPQTKAPVPPANFMSTRAAKLRDQIPPKGSYEIPKDTITPADPAGAPDRIAEAKAAYEAEIEAVKKNEKPAIEWPDSQPDIPPVNWRDSLPKPAPAPRKDVLAKPNEIIEEPPTANEARLKEEERYFPGSTKVFGKASEGGYYTPKEMNDRQLNEHITNLQNLITYVKRTPGKRMPAGTETELKAMVGELTRREQRKVLNLEKDWNQEDLLASESEPQTLTPGKPLEGKVEQSVVVPDAQKLPPREQLDTLTLDELNKIDDTNFSKEDQQALGDALLRRMDVELREAEAQQQAAQVQPAEPIGPRYTVEKTETGSKIVDTQTGEIVSENKNGLEQNSRRAEQLNSLSNNPEALEAELRRGSRNTFGVKKGEPGIREQIVKAGSELPEGHKLSEPLQKVADLKQRYDEARAQFFSLVDAYNALIGKSPVFGIPKRLPIFMEQVENLSKEALKQGNLDELSIEVQNEFKLEPKDRSRFKRGTSEADAYAEVKRASDEHQALKDELSQARGAVKDEFLRSDLGQSVNVRTPKGVVNIRAVPKQRSELNARAEALKGPVPEEAEIQRTITDVKRSHKELAAQYDEAATTTKPKPRGRGRRNQKGSVTLVGGRQQANATEIALAKGAEKSKEITDLANSAEKVKSLLTTKHSFDILKDIGTVNLDDTPINLHNEIWLAVAKETTLARRAKFGEVDPNLLDETLRMSADEIRTDQSLLSKFTPEQVNFLATRKELRSETASILRDSAGLIKEEYKSIAEMPNKVRHQYEVLQQLAESFSPRGSIEGTSEFALMKQFRSFMYDYIFKWNPAYHGLNLLDPFVLGSSRVGIQNVVRAKALLQDPIVKEYMKAVPSKDVIKQLREESSMANQPKLKETGLGKAFRKVAEFKDKLPDLPSERWNFEDSFIAGAIMRGDRIYGKGRGAQYVKDLASGKLSLSEEVANMVDSLQVADDLTGSASLGINKNPFQRVGFANSFAQFVSQPIRVTRLLRRYIAEKDIGGLLTFAAMNVAFGGRALLPQEVDVLKAHPGLRKTIEGLEDFLDTGNVAKNVPVIGRDLTEKLRYSALIPFAGGISTPLVNDFVLKFMKDYEGERWNHVTKSAFIMGLVATLGGGGAEANRIVSNIQGLMEGDREMYAFTRSGKVKGSDKFSNITGEKFDLGNAVKEAVLPGDNPKVAAFKKSALRK